MTRPRCRVAVLAAIAVTASIFAYAPGAAAQTAPQDTGGHQVSIDALDNYGYHAGVEMFAGTGCADSDELCPEEPVLRWEIAVLAGEDHRPGPIRPRSGRRATTTSTPAPGGLRTLSGWLTSGSTCHAGPTSCVPTTP